ncbi:unnamed protein product [Rotaria magnacalcarata]
MANKRALHLLILFSISLTINANNSIYSDKDFENLFRRMELLEKKAMTAIIRKNMSPAGLQRIQLSNQLMEYSISLRNYLPAKEYIKAVLLSVTLNHGNNPYAHAYLGFEAYQEDCDKDKKTTFIENSSNAYYTVHQRELIVPWNNNENHGSHNLIISITSSYNTGSYLNEGNQNYFKIHLSGYIA